MPDFSELRSKTFSRHYTCYIERKWDFPKLSRYILKWGKVKKKKDKGDVPNFMPRETDGSRLGWDTSVSRLSLKLQLQCGKPNYSSQQQEGRMRYYGRSWRGIYLKHTWDLRVVRKEPISLGNYDKMEINSCQFATCKRSSEKRSKYWYFRMKL